MISDKQLTAREKWGGQNAKLRRLAYIRRRYAAPPKCRQCPALAHWSWAPQGNNVRLFFCPDHLPKQAKAALGMFNQILFEVAPFFDEPEQEDTSYL